MSIITKQLVLHQLMLPRELIDVVKEYAFRSIKKIPKEDERYDLLLRIPPKEYDELTDLTFVYLDIHQKKDYFLTYRNYEIQLQTFMYGDDGDPTVYGVDATRVFL